MKFEWNETKARKNFLKHEVLFTEAQTVFDDLLYIDLYDADHSKAEDRYIAVGVSLQGRLLIVLYTERAQSIRIISARTATSYERRAYEEG